MAKIILTMKIMPEDTEVDLEAVFKEAEHLITKYSNSVEVTKEIEPVGYGVNALKVKFVMDESKGSPDELEDQLRNVEGVMSVEIVDVRRAVG